MDFESSARQPLEMSNSKKIDLKTYRIKGQGKCPPIINFLLISSTIGLFIYVNSYFLYKISKVMNGTVSEIKTQTFSCQNYFCNEAAYNFINYNTFFDDCNQKICSPICANYTCGQKNTEQNINYYYACQKTACGSWEQNIPSEVKTSFGLAITAACSMGLAALLSIAYSIYAIFFSGNLTQL